MSGEIKLKKTLYIGLGGTGVATLLRVKKCFIDSYGEVPPMIGFLAIDTDTAAFNKEVTSNLNKKIKLAPNELLVVSVKGALATYKNNPRDYDWVPELNVDKLSSIAGSGAGAVRSNGRFITYYNYEQIKNNIQAVVTQINQHIPQTSKYTVDTNKNGIEFPVTINVFASVAGGTGSGMLVDVLCLVNQALNDLALQFDVYPWIVLPEIFKAINNGPAMSNVNYNSYGALRELDYTQHLNPTQPSINFGYTKIDERLFRYAYLINNLNLAGVAFNKLDDLLDVIAKSAFLPANKMGDDLVSPFDNIKNQQDGGVYDIKDKKAWVASAGSAELIYDSHAVGRAIAYRIISQLCNSMLSSHDGTQCANDFVDHQDVLIRENNGRNDVTDYLLSTEPEYSLTIDESTNESDIQSYIDYNCGQRIQDLLSSNLDRKLESVKLLVDKQVAELLDNTASGCVGMTIAFISALRKIISLCNLEMHNEQKDLNTLNNLPIQWKSYINQLPKKGIGAFFGTKYNEDAVSILEQELRRYIRNVRDEQRHLSAIRFYNALDTYLLSIETKLNNLQAYLNSVHDEYRDKLLTQQQLSDSTSKFQMFLHKKDVDQMGLFNISESIKASFHKYFADKGGLGRWLHLSKEQIADQMFDFTKGTTDVINAINVSIDDVLRKMSEREIKSYLEQLQILASPLWSYNTQGYRMVSGSMDKFVIVGVGDRSTSFLRNDTRFKNFFDTNGNSASYASTNQNDRIYVLVVEDLLPIYAVNNFSTYESDYNNKISRGTRLACYIDEKLNNRMSSENFHIMPTIEQDNVLQLWVYGFIFGYIHYDKEKNKYWIRTKQKGDAIDGFRFDLASERDVAYDIFKTEMLYKEIEDNLNKKIQHEGNDKIQGIIDTIKSNESYHKEYAQMSSLEEANIREPKFASVRRLLEQEIRFMSE